MNGYEGQSRIAILSGSRVRANTWITGLGQHLDHGFGPTPGSRVRANTWVLLGPGLTGPYMGDLSRPRRDRLTGAELGRPCPGNGFGSVHNRPHSLKLIKTFKVHH